jgi:hypothetical protein
MGECFINNFVSYGAQMFFGLRAYHLWGRRRVVGYPLFFFIHATLLLQCAIDIRAFIFPKFDANSPTEQLAKIDAWVAGWGKLTFPGPMQMCCLPTISELPHRSSD